MGVQGDDVLALAALLTFTAFVLVGMITVLTRQPYATTRPWPATAAAAVTTVNESLVAASLFSLPCTMHKIAYDHGKVRKATCSEGLHLTAWLGRVVVSVLLLVVTSHDLVNHASEASVELRVSQLVACVWDLEASQGLGCVTAAKVSKRKHRKTWTTEEGKALEGGSTIGFARPSHSQGPGTISTGEGDDDIPDLQRPQRSYHVATGCLATDAAAAGITDDECAKFRDAAQQLHPRLILAGHQILQLYNLEQGTHVDLRKTLGNVSPTIYWSELQDGSFVIVVRQTYRKELEEALSAAFPGSALKVRYDSLEPVAEDVTAEDTRRVKLAAKLEYDHKVENVDTRSSLAAAVYEYWLRSIIES